MNCNKSTIILFLFLTTIGCTKITKQNLLGEWSTLPITDSTKYHSVIFENNIVKLIDDFEFIEQGIYEIEGSQLIIKIKNQRNLITKIADFSKDSIIMFDQTYYKGLDFGDRNYDIFELPSIDSKKKLNLNTLSHIFHIYCKNDSLRIRYGERLIKTKHLQSALLTGHGQNYGIDLFVDKELNLKKLKEIYYQLVYCHINKVNLVVNKTAPLEYRIITDYIEIFNDDFEDYFKNIPPLPPTDYFKTRQSYIGTNGEIIEVKKAQDITKVKNLIKNKNYLISIDNQIKVENYLKIKEIINLIRKTRNIKIRTEII